MRSQAKALSDLERKRIASETADLFPIKVAPPKHRHRSGWRQLAAAFVIGAVLFSMAPAMARNSLDIPGIGMLVQKVALRHTGLDWAFENGYMRGTLVQVSSGEVTVRILGYLADPVHTTVIYLVQGVDQAAIDANQVPVVIQSIQGEGAISWGGEIMSTSVGFVGTVHTWAIPDSEAILNLRIGTPAGNDMNVVLPVSREEVSKLARTQEIGLAHTIEGITVDVDTVTVTPSQLLVEYRIRGQGAMTGGGLSRLEPLRLEGPGINLSHRAGSGGSYDYETDEWRLRAIFDRPNSILGLQFVVPNLARHITVNFEWPLEGETASAISGSLVAEIYDISFDGGEVFFRYKGVDGLRDFSLAYADGSKESISHPVISWIPGEWTGVKLRVKEGATPIAVHAHGGSVIIEGPWLIPLVID